MSTSAGAGSVRGAVTGTAPDPMGLGPGEWAPTVTARRSSRPSWRDPRILAGVVLMACSVLAGAALVGGSDDTVAVLRVRHPIAAGSALDGHDLESTRVRFADARALQTYLTTRADLPAHAVATRALEAGELLPAAAIGTEQADIGMEVPIAVAADDLPATVRRGSVVDVWVVPEAVAGSGAGAGAGGSVSRARLVLEGVGVLRVSGGEDTLAPRPTRQVIVRAPEDAKELARALGDLGAGRPVLVRRP